MSIDFRSLFYDILCPQELESCQTCIHDDFQKCIDDMNYPGTMVFSIMYQPNGNGDSFGNNPRLRTNVRS